MADVIFTMKVRLDSKPLNNDLREISTSFNAFEQKLARMVMKVITKISELTEHLKNFVPDSSYVKKAGDTFVNDLRKSLKPAKLASSIVSGAVAELVKKMVKGLFSKENKNLIINGFKSIKGIIDNNISEIRKKVSNIFGLINDDGGFSLETLKIHFDTVFGYITTNVYAAFGYIDTKVKAGFAKLSKGFLAGFATLKKYVLGFFATLKKVLLPKLALLLGPKGLILAAVIGLVILVVKNWDTIRDAALAVWDKITDFVRNAVDTIRNVFSTVVDWFSDNWQAILLFVVNPFAGAFKLLYDNFEGFRNFVDGIVEAVRGFFESLWNWLKDTASSTWEGIKAIWGTVSGWFKGSVITPVKDFFKAVWEFIKEAASNAWDGIVSIWEAVSGWFNDNIITPLTDFFRDVFEFIKEAASNAWDGIMGIWKAVTGWFDDNIITPLRDGFSALWEGVKKAVETTWNAITDTVKGSANAVLTVIEGVVNGAITAVNGITGAISRALSSLSIDLPDWLGGHSFGLNINIPQIPSIQIPRLATGAVIAPNDPFLAILGDQRQGKNIEAPLSAIEDAVSNVFHSISATAANPFNSLAIAAMASSGGRMGSGEVKLDNRSIAAIVNGISQSFATSLSDYMSEGAASSGNLVLELNGRELARASWDDLANEAGRRGVKLAY